MKARALDLVFILFIAACSDSADRHTPGTESPPLGDPKGAGDTAGTNGGAGTLGASGSSAGAGAAGRNHGGSTDIDDAGPVIAADAMATAGSFKLLNYNVHGLPPLITGDDTPGRMRQIAPLLEGFDLIGLQEDWDLANHDLLVMSSTHAYQDHFDDPLPMRLYGAGLSVLSAYEILERHNEHYAACFGELLGPGLTDCVSSKGYQVTRLRMSNAAGGELDFYNTHLDAGIGAEDLQAREAQIDELLESMASYSAGRAIVFVSDTNASQNQLSRLIQGAALRDACVEVSCPNVSRIERIFVRNSDALRVDVTAWQLEDAFYDAAHVPLSDHPAVSAVIDWHVVVN